MKRFIGSTLFAVVFGTVAFAQAPFTIVRPADGSKVREQVHILFPKTSIPAGGYVGIFVNGQFIEATVPPTGAKYIDYTLDTKKLNLVDGPATVEARLYVDFNEKPRVVDTSSIQVTIANQASINVPDEGLKLRYKFTAGTELVYRLRNEVKLSAISEAQAARGGRAAERSVDADSARVLYAVDNKYSDGDGLLRLQLLPEKGKKFIELATPSAPKGRRFEENSLAPVYMRVHNTGMEVFSSVPTFSGAFGGGGGTPSPIDLMVMYPLPTLPTKAVRPGDVWQTRFQMGDWDLKNAYNVNSLTEKVPARGEFLNVEWEAGHPCAKIRHSLELGSNAKKGQVGKDTLALEETIWFALDLGQVIRMDRSQVLNTRMTTPAAAAAGRPGATTGSGRPGSAGTGRGAGASDFGETMNRPAINLKQGKTGRMSGQGERRGAASQSNRGAQTQQPVAQAPASQGGTLQRLTIYQTFILEK